MRNFGGILLLLGILGFFYATTQLGNLAPLPQGLSLGDSFDTPAGRWEMARWAAAVVAAFGLLMALFPKGR